MQAFDVAVATVSVAGGGLLALEVLTHTHYTHTTHTHTLHTHTWSSTISDN